MANKDEKMTEKEIDKIPEETKAFLENLGDKLKEKFPAFNLSVMIKETGAAFHIRDGQPEDALWLGLVSLERSVTGLMEAVQRFKEDHIKLKNDMEKQNAKRIISPYGEGN